MNFDLHTWYYKEKSHCSFIIVFLFISDYEEFTLNIYKIKMHILFPVLSFQSSSQTLTDPLLRNSVSHELNLNLKRIRISFFSWFSQRLIKWISDFLMKYTVTGFYCISLPLQINYPLSEKSYFIYMTGKTNLEVMSFSVRT